LCEDPAVPASTREHVLALIDAGVTYIVLAAIACPGPPAQWLVKEIIEPVLAQTRR
jgi:hypothetical protein